MINIYTSFWVYRDGMPIKRFIGDSKQNEAVVYANDQRNYYPGSRIKVSKQRMSEQDIWEADPVEMYDKKEVHDA